MFPQVLHTPSSQVHMTQGFLLQRLVSRVQDAIVYIYILVRNEISSLVMRGLTYYCSSQQTLLIAKRIICQMIVMYLLDAKSLRWPLICPLIFWILAESSATATIQLHFRENRLENKITTAEPTVSRHGEMAQLRHAAF